MKKILSLAFMGALLSAVSLVSAREIVFTNQSDQDVVVTPNYDSWACRTDPFDVHKGDTHNFDAGTVCYGRLESIDVKVPGKTTIESVSIDGNKFASGPSSVIGTSHVAIAVANNALTATVTN